MVKSAEEINIIATNYVNLVSKAFYVKKAVLFGSYVSGVPNNNSDLDIAIISDDFEFIPYDVLLKILFKMARNVNTMIEPIPLTSEEYDNPELGSITYDVVKKGKPMLIN